MCEEHEPEDPATDAIDHIDSIDRCLLQASGIIYCAQVASNEMSGDSDVTSALWVAHEKLDELRKHFKKLHP